jgi:hypothetical protein
MAWLPIVLGLMLGAGVLLAIQGFAGVIDRRRPEADRRKALWKLNGGLALAAISMVAFMRFGG